MKSALEVLEAFDKIRRGQRAGVYAPHKPLLILLALARVQRGEPRLVAFTEIDALLQRLLAGFGPSGAGKSRHYPFWHLATDGQGALWSLSGPRDIVATLGLDLDGPSEAQEAAPLRAGDVGTQRRRRDPGFRERVLRAYEYRCCVCGFDLRVGLAPAGLEAAHIQWHHVGGPDIEPNGLSLCALHHKLFDLGAFTVEPSEHRVVFSQHAISGGRGMVGELQFHGRPIHAPQHADLRPASDFLAWNLKYVFKSPARQAAASTPRAAR